MKTRTGSAIFAFFLLLALQSNAQGFLKAKGKIIVNSKGEKVILRGMGIGGWMLQEGYMFRLSHLGQQYRIKEKIKELVGEEKTKQFYNEWLQNHTTKTDIDSMAAWGFNSIRLPMHYNLYTLPVEAEPVAGKNTWLEKGFQMTDDLLKWCAANKIYLILDLHATPGGQGNDLPISDRDPSKPLLWQSEANREKMIALWKKLAARYAKEEWIGGYDIINEPNYGFEDPKDTRGTSETKNVPLQQLMTDITKAIREVDKKHIIIIEGNGFGNNYNGITPTWDDNLVMSFHKYGNFNNTGSISRFLELRDKFNIPLWLGESGENSNTWFTEAISLAEKNDIGWAWWQSKKMGINNPLEIKQPEGYQKFLDYTSGKGPKIPEEEAWKILQELLSNLRIQNNIYHRDVTDAMFRQVQGSGTKPFKKLVIDKPTTTIAAVDFDMGSQRVAYYDRDSSRYQYTPGVNTVGNKGNTYRNDGVDIQKDKDGPYVFSIEDGEWLHYTIEVKEAGRYRIAYTVGANEEGGSILLSNDNGMPDTAAVPVTGADKNFRKVESAGVIQLKKGVNFLKLTFGKGGFVLRDLSFTKQ
ncbi:cellulase family glycosylhydrolase [Sediminibacterium roseum]|uniref:Cellulase family glycosylhydrolase n=1 Tax=Sediminibacterium roseum TaxID=1978412 RepID=A0ABW9ZRG0_9BACT|nr:cellulase family glycosylhydrolase [Sediminibacterium roseum]NCI49697.1 cellulase family glycosylhydrolase [Sediminibacterium roseum]